ncbi:MAG TPA: hypothetical protein VLG50_08625, partial [Candidatus Saccharimonadales bacterium]|nr:hypothetical protein [Candidatus Saccharimonadales bacterium]
SYIVITSIAQFTQLQSANLFVFLGTIGAILALFGLFKFKSGLRAGLLLAGLLSILSYNDNNVLFSAVRALTFVMIAVFMRVMDEAAKLIPIFSTLTYPVLFCLTFLLLAIILYGIFHLKRSKHWKQWLLGLLLFVFIPATVWLGLQIIYPKVDLQHYYEKREKFFRGYKLGEGTPKEQKQWEQRNIAWNKTKEAIDYEYKKCLTQFILLMGCGLFSLALFFIATTATPVIAACLILNGLLLQVSATITSCSNFSGLNLIILQALFAFIGLIMILRAARRDSRN